MFTKISMVMIDENGPPTCESFVATCTLEFDEEAPAPQYSEAFQRAVHSAVAVCCQTIHKELRRQQAGASPVHRNTP